MRTPLILSVHLTLLHYSCHVVITQRMRYNLRSAQFAISFQICVMLSGTGVKSFVRKSDNNKNIYEF